MLLHVHSCHVNVCRAFQHVTLNSWDSWARRDETMCVCLHACAMCMHIQIYVHVCEHNYNGKHVFCRCCKTNLVYHWEFHYDFCVHFSRVLCYCGCCLIDSKHALNVSFSKFQDGFSSKSYMLPMYHA